MVLIVGIPIIILVSVSIWYSIWYFNPTKIFQRKFDFPLPKSSVVNNYKFFYFDEENLYMKVSFVSDYYAELEEKLEGYFHGERVNNPELIFYSLYSAGLWWDINEDELVLAYSATRDGKRAKSRDVFAYITRDSEGQYCLYIKH